MTIGVSHLNLDWRRKKAKKRKKTEKMFGPKVTGRGYTDVILTRSVILRSIGTEPTTLVR